MFPNSEVVTMFIHLSHSLTFLTLISAQILTHSYPTPRKITQAMYQGIGVFLVECVSLKVLFATIDAQWEGMGDVGVSEV